MYNPIHIDAFIEKVNAEAAQAAQKVYDKYQSEFEARILNQLQKGDILTFGMGTVSLSKKSTPRVDLPYGYAEKFLDVLTRTQYNPDLECGFSTDEMEKK